RSESLFGLSLVYLTFEDDVESFWARTMVSERIQSADVPDGVTPVLGPDTTPLGQIFEYRLHSDRHTLAELRSEQEWTVGPMLRRVAGVGDVVSRGSFLKEVHVEVDPARLIAHGLQLRDVTDAIARANVNVGGGFFRRGEQQMVIRGVGYFSDANEIKQVALKNSQGIPITVDDIGRVMLSHTPRQGSFGFNEQLEAVQGVVFLRRGENPSVVLDALHEQVRALNDSILPEGMAIEPLYDRSLLVNKTLQTVHTNLLEGALLAFGVVWLFIRSLRGSVVVVTIIPLSLLTAFIGLYLLKMPANLISMGAIDFGILVDGAVVLVENVIRRYRQERPDSTSARIKLVTDAAVDVARPVLFAMAIIIASLIPVFTLERVEGRIFKPLALTYSFALLGALIFALTFIPALAVMLLRGKGMESREPGWIESLRNHYEKLITVALRRRPVVFLCAVLLLGAGGVGASRLGTEFLPELDEGDILVFVEMPSSISLDDGQQLLRDVRRRLLAFPEVLMTTSQQGRPEDGTDNESVNMSETFVRLKPKSQWRKGMTKPRLEESMREALSEIPGVRFNFSQPIRDNVEEAMSGVRGQVVLKIFGTDLAVMRDTLQRAIEVLQPMAGVVDLSLYRDREVPQLEIRTDRAAIARAGISVDVVQDVIETALAGKIVTELWEGERIVPIRVQLAPGDREDVSRIAEIPVSNDRGTVYPLGHLSVIDAGTGRASINRENNSRSLALKFNVEGRDMGSAVHEAIETVRQKIIVPEGTYLQWGGEFENQQRAMGLLMIIAPLALLVVVSLLCVGLRSFRGGAAVLIVMPVALTGGIFSLLFTGVHASISAAIGFVTLLGQVSLMALLILGAIDEERQRGMSLHEAIRTGSVRRMRAVLLASLLAVLGLMPMAANSGMGSETQRPFALVIVGGMSTTLLVSLLVLPIIYSLLASPVVSPSKQEES
ncbi:MAG TPA: CusA/CzcA family heavy metal efflux RND transporter, partial [Polyangiaceae bacterium]|nr:CusA/CzcA family heavy metal efflux RND transporter [Polyangiaceae bacterium]